MASLGSTRSENYRKYHNFPVDWLMKEIQRFRLLEPPQSSDLITFRRSSDIPTHHSDRVSKPRREAILKYNGREPIQLYGGRGAMSRRRKRSLPSRVLASILDRVRTYLSELRSLPGSLSRTRSFKRLKQYLTTFDVEWEQFRTQDSACLSSTCKAGTHCRYDDVRIDTLRATRLRCGFSWLLEGYIRV